MCKVEPCTICPKPTKSYQGPALVYPVVLVKTLENMRLLTLLRLLLFSFLMISTFCHTSVNYNYTFPYTILAYFPIVNTQPKPKLFFRYLAQKSPLTCLAWRRAKACASNIHSCMRFSFAPLRT